DDPATATDERQHLRNATQLLPKLPQEDSCSRKGTGSAKKTVEVRAQFVRPLGPSVQLMHSTGPTHDNSEQSSIMGSPLNTAHVLRFLVEGHAHTSTDCCRWFTRRRWILLHGTSRGPDQPSPIARIVVPNSTGFSQCAASCRPGRNHSASSSDIATPDPTGERTLSFRKNDHYWRAS